MSNRGGRGYGGRGGYGSRSGYRGTYRGGSTRGYEGRGGRGGGYASYNDNRYNTSNSERYGSSRDRVDDSYKKMYRSETSTNYSSRDYMGRSGSPERKRMRMEGSSSDRRSHDGGGHYGGSYGSRQESYVSDRRPFGEERRRSPSRDGGYRKSGGMPPPRTTSALRSRVSRPPRRSFRGRILRARGTYRGSIRSRGTYTAKRFGDRQVDYSRAFRSVKARSTVKSKPESASSTEEDWDAEEKEVPEVKKEVKTKSPKIEMEDVEEEVAQDGEDTDKEGGAAGSDEAEQPVQRSRVTGRPFIQLLCVHCKEKSITFAGYAKHLLSSKHRVAMGGVARRHKAQLLRMRLAQRGAQRELEAAHGADLAARTTYCLICRLNHRTTRQAHNLTDTHRAMKRFLMPYCRICRITFRSPMIYEHHICSLDHIKRKANQVPRPPTPKAEGSGDEGMDVDLDNFMTLDSVGDVDEVDDDESGGEKKEDEVPKKPKVEINIGNEHIKKVEVFWCDLCKIYLSRSEPGSAEEAEILRRHCRMRLHLGRYVRHRDTRTLRKQAERIHRQLQQQKEGDKATEGPVAAKEEKAESIEERKKKPVENGTDLNATGGGEDKLWADVDKDIGELLREVDPQGNEASDDDDDLDRYDKFRKSDKNLIESGDAHEDNDTAVAEDNIEKTSAEIKTAA